MATLLSEYKMLTAQIENLSAKRNEVRNKILSDCKTGYREGKLRLKIISRKGNIQYKRILDENGIEYDPELYRSNPTHIIQIKG